MFQQLLFIDLPARSRALTCNRKFLLIYSIYKWAIGIAEHRYALLGLAIVSFLESSIFPIPPDVILIPMIIACRNDAWKIAFVCTLSSVLGGIGGYQIGYLLFEEIGRPILEIYGYSSKFVQFQIKYNEWGAWAVFMAGITPFPYKVITILSGAAELDLFIFSFASILARGLRFFVLAWLLWKFGEQIRLFIERRLGLIFALFFLILFGGFLIVKVFL